MTIELDLPNFGKKIADDEYYLWTQIDNNLDTHYLSIILMEDNKVFLESRKDNPFPLMKAV